MSEQIKRQSAIVFGSFYLSKFLLHFQTRERQDIGGIIFLAVSFIQSPHFIAFGIGKTQVVFFSQDLIFNLAMFIHKKKLQKSNLKILTRPGPTPPFSKFISYFYSILPSFFRRAVFAHKPCASKRLLFSSVLTSAWP